MEKEDLSMTAELTTALLPLIVWLDGIESVKIELVDGSNDLRGATNAAFGTLVAETRSIQACPAMAPTVRSTQSWSLGGGPNDANKFSPQR